MKFLQVRVYAVTIVVSALLTACGGNPTKPDESSDSTGGATTSGVVVDGTVGENIDSDTIAGRAPKERTIYFGFDDADIQSQYLALVAEHGRYLASNPTGRVRLEGHTDERGTREYNIALGETRAKAVARMLQLQGVSSAQFRAITYGEELPVDDGHTPSAWEKNRRVNIVYEVE